MGTDAVAGTPLWLQATIGGALIAWTAITAGGGYAIARAIHRDRREDATRDRARQRVADRLALDADPHAGLMTPLPEQTYTGGRHRVDELVNHYEDHLTRIDVTSDWWRTDTKDRTS